MKSSIFTSIVGLLVFLTTGFVCVAALVPLPAYLAAGRLLIVAVGCVALSVLLGLYLALKLIFAALGRFPAAGNFPSMTLPTRAGNLAAKLGDLPASSSAAPGATRAPAAPRTAPVAHEPWPAPSSCQILLASVLPQASAQTCGRCGCDDPGYACGVHRVALCGGCLPIHVLEAA